MFGYVKPFKPQLRICEFDAYQSIYCGLCRQIGKSYGRLARMSLSYDFVFLALLGMALKQAPPTISDGRCMLKPTKKRPFCQTNEQMQFACGCAMIMLYYKARDNIQDNPFFKRLLYYPALWVAGRARKKAMVQYPKAEEAIRTMMFEQNALENARCTSVDQACEPTAKALSALFAQLAEDPKQQRILAQMGYFAGRYVYLCDAVSDITEDIQKKNYNPYVLSHNLTQTDDPKVLMLKQQAQGDIFLTIAQIQSAYELLDIHHFAPILENILYQGLKYTTMQITAKETNHD